MCVTCSNCNKEIHKDFSYCPYCGAKNYDGLPKMVYHYTKKCTLCSIAEGIQEEDFFLWANNYEKMNDPTDCRYLLHLFQKQIKEDKRDNISKINTPYLVSFSRNGDDLHMWNCYADTGKGVSIGIDYNELQKALDEYSKDGHITARLYSCKYLDESQVSNYEEIGTYIQKLRDTNNPYYLANEELPYIIKHPAYREEDEFRIILLNSSLYYQSKKCNHDKEKDIFKIPIPKTAIKEIIVGPCADKGQIEKQFQSFFPETEFKTSQIPYCI